MDLQASKIELAKLILDIQSQDIIDKVLEVLRPEPVDFYDELSDAEKTEINLGIEQLNNGEKISLEDYMKKVL